MKKFFTFIAAVLFAGGMMAENLSVSIQSYAETNSWANGTKYTTLNMNSDVTVIVEGGSNSGKYYTNGNEWRIYQNENPTITISTTVGTISSVTITYNIGNTGVLKDAGVDVPSGTEVLVNAASKEFTVGNSGTATNGQVKITQIEVSYEAGPAPAVATPVITGDALFFDSTIVTMSCTTQDADIYYTTDGRDPKVIPDNESIEYLHPITIKATTTFNVAAYTGNDWSATVAKTFTKAPSFDSFEALVAAELPNNTKVQVSFEDLVIDSIYTNNSGKRQGLYFTVGTTAYEIYYNKAEVPATWEAGGVVSGTIRGNWTIYNNLWEIVPLADDWAWALDYDDPQPQPAVLSAVSDSTTWDFTKVAANTESSRYANQGIQLTDASVPSKTDEVIYSQYSDTLLTIAAGFNADALAFKGEYPIRKNQYCQAGTLHFKADVAGSIVVKFSDTGTSASATAVKRYLVVNDSLTEYWTSRENNGTENPYAEQLNVVTGAIPVPAGDVTIKGSKDIIMYYVTFVPVAPPTPVKEAITVAEAVQIGLALDSAATSDAEYTVEGYVISAMDFSLTNMNQSFYMADEATATESQFEGYNCYPIDGADTVKVLVGDKVSLTGKIKHFRKNGKSTIEIEKANVVFISKAEGDRSIDKTVEEITVAQALAIGAALDADKVSAKTYDIVGYITQIDDNSFDTNYNNMTFWIADAQGTAATNADGAFEVFRGRPAEELKVGWKVVVRDQIKNYKGNTIETATTNCPVTILEKSEQPKPELPEGVISCDSAVVLASALEDPTADNKTVVDSSAVVKVRGYVTFAYDLKDGKQSAWLADSKTANAGVLQGAYLQTAEAVVKGDYVELEGYLAKYYQVGKNGNPDKIIVEVINGTMAKVGAEGIENIVLTEKAQKVLVDGVIYIIRDNKMYNIQGERVR